MNHWVKPRSAKSYKTKSGMPENNLKSHHWMLRLHRQAAVSTQHPVAPPPDQPVRMLWPWATPRRRQARHNSRQTESSSLVQHKTNRTKSSHHNRNLHDFNLHDFKLMSFLIRDITYFFFTEHFWWGSECYRVYMSKQDTSQTIRVWSPGASCSFWY